MRLFHRILQDSLDLLDRGHGAACDALATIALHLKGLQHANAKAQAFFDVGCDLLGAGVCGMLFSECRLELRKRCFRARQQLSKARCDLLRGCRCGNSRRLWCRNRERRGLRGRRRGTHGDELGSTFE